MVMTTRTKPATTLAHAIVRTPDTHGRSDRINVDMLRVFAALRPYLPGLWDITKQGEVELHDGKACRWLRIVRKADGLCLNLDASTDYNREAAIRVSMGGYSYPSGSQIDARWCRERAEMPEPVARMRIDKAHATPQRIVADIVRRVITPAEAILPHINKLIADDQARMDKRAACIAALRKAGQKVWERGQGSSDARVEWGSNSAEIQSDGGLRLSHVYIAPSDAVRFAEFMATVQRGE